jgi:hypothetical protein
VSIRNGLQHGILRLFIIRIKVLVQHGQRHGQLIMKLEKHGITPMRLLTDITHTGNGDQIHIKVIKITPNEKRLTSVGLFFA